MNIFTSQKVPELNRKFSVLEAKNLNDIKSEFDSCFWFARATIELSPGWL